MQRVLLVDDDTEFLMIVTQSLKNYGYQVISLAEGGQVLETIRQFKPNIVIIDINIRQVDGRTITASIRQIEDYQHLPVILISGSIFKQDEIDTFKANAFIQKPVATELFLTTIQQLIAAA